jgi:N-methylhydantoinase A
MIESMVGEARSVVALGAADRPLTEQHTAFARYVGQGHEIPIALPGRVLEEGDRAVLRQAFEDAYSRQYGRLIDGVDIEILTWTVTVSAPAAAIASIPSNVSSGEVAPRRQRKVFDVGEGRYLETTVHRRLALTPGKTVIGPAVIVEDSTSTVLGPGYDAEITADGSILMTRRGLT